MSSFGMRLPRQYIVAGSGWGILGCCKHAARSLNYLLPQWHELGREGLSVARHTLVCSQRQYGRY
jgi:hypothetical protein